MIQHATELLSEKDKPKNFRSEVQHVDGKYNAFARKRKLEWLEEDSESHSCRILTNAKCLSEGIDVPALDAVLFLEPRKSHVDVVQSVGRVMRKFEHKKFGYIILPVAVPAGVEPSKVLDNDKSFDVVWSVLRALRSHDDRFNAEVNQIDLNANKTHSLVIFDETGTTDTLNLHFPHIDIPPGQLFAKIVEKCGDRKYWENWANDVADIHTRLVERIRNLLDNPQDELLPEWFDSFLEELKSSINKSVTRGNAIEMMAQHILTQPVFDSLFEHYNFAKNNPVAHALDNLRQDLGEFGFEEEIRDLESFYESVRLRVQGLDNSEARQRVLMELYEKFFKKAMKKDTKRLGIVYTPVEIVDFIVNSVDGILRKELKSKISDENVHVLDPFAGTGIFLVRLLQSDLIHKSDLKRKFRNELHANEIVLLAYYIATVHIEETFHGQLGQESEYESFNGIAWTDTFNLHTKKTGFPKSWLSDNSTRVKNQQNRKIQVIIGNPPWSVGQKSATDDNPNVDYPEMKRRIRDTYVAIPTKRPNKNSLYDYYKMAIRWASDRIEDQGVIGFVTNGSWIEGLADAGVRACLEKEFSLIYILNLRGNKIIHGEISRREGESVFGQRSRVTVAITLLVRNPNRNHEECQIYYHDIGDYLNRDVKMKILKEAKSIYGISSWLKIHPDSHNDWIKQRGERFQKFFPVGSEPVKTGKSDDAIFRLYSNGLKTGRDSYMYNYSREMCTENATNMVENYSHALEELKRSSYTLEDIDSVTRRNSNCIKWDDNLKSNLKQSKSIVFDPNKIITTQYRPFVKQFLYSEKVLIQRTYQMGSIYPFPSSENHVICISGGVKQYFSVLIVNHIPDLGILSSSQCFPRYQYHSVVNSQLHGVNNEQKQVDNITDIALHKFRANYRDKSITKDMIFNYVYGILHSPKYKNEFANDLSKELPRIPLAQDFHEYSNAGHKLMDLHLNYESCSEYPLNLEIPNQRQNLTKIYKIQKRRMRFVDSEKTILQISDFVKLYGIPSEAHDYQVNGKTPLEWFINRYLIKQNDGIINDPNAWFKDPFELIQAIRRIVYVSVESAKIIQNLPEPFDSD